MAANHRYATFYLNGIHFGVNVKKVQEVLEFQEITPIPLSPAVLPGIINLRGQILATIDLKARLNLPAGERNGRPMMVVLRTSDGPMNLLVDKIGEVVEADPGLFEKPADTLSAEVRSVTTHMCKLEKQLLLLLDAERIIQVPDEMGEAGAAAKREKIPSH